MMCISRWCFCIFVASIFLIDNLW